MRSLKWCKVCVLVLMCAELVFAAPQKVFTKYVEPSKDNSLYTKKIKPYFELPSDGSSQPERVYEEKYYAVEWYKFYDSSLHLDEVKMSATEKLVNEFFEQARYRFQLSEKYKKNVHEIFFRSTMMFRLASNGYSTAYVEELDYIFRRFSDLDTEIKSLGIKTLRDETDRVAEAAIMAGIDELRLKGKAARPLIEEVLITIVDLTSRKKYKNKVRGEYNKINRGSRVFSRILIYIIVILGATLLSADLTFSPSFSLPTSDAVIANLCSSSISFIVVHQVCPLEFRRRQNYLFNQVGQTCSKILNSFKVSAATSDGQL